MEEYITRGQNLKVLRKKLGLKQYEITGGEITRNLISLIEHDKTPLHEGVARLISENINKISDERNMDIVVFPEDLMNPVRLKAKSLADEYISKLKIYLEDPEKEIDKKLLEDMEFFLQNWNLPDKKSKAYEMLGDIYEKRNDFEKMYIYLTKALENYFLKPYNKDINKLILKLSFACMHTKRYEESINLTNLALSYEDTVEKYGSKVYYNRSVIFNRMKNYDKALVDLEKCRVLLTSKNKLDEDEKVRLKRLIIVEGNCYKNKKEYLKAIEVYQKMYNMTEEIQSVGEKCAATMNIAETYEIMDNKEKVREYILKSEELLDEIAEDSFYKTRIYQDLAERYKYLKDEEKTKHYYERALNNFDPKKEKEGINNLLLDFINFYRETNSTEDISTLISNIEEMVEHINVDLNIRLLLNYLLFNIENNRVVDSMNIINKLLNKGEN
ncbi:hypothetical protein GOQ27_12030 [Clostridium sp. D2Q-11]|uniref:Tetratricopeptide repeat protein n=1 Tax=Anaeromonas frigoriresistens TaxID=2683708 RepID=A0A942Z9U4_9FIRM|nr:hypothetical protein [Anaeromonas frigoriresistens]MBS4539195.1 hypothetical protein [Anaeromonas frigoriresistens]